MNKLVEVLGTAVLGIAGLFFLRIAHAVFGGVSAWVVGFVFGEPILRFFAILGIHGFSMFQLGVVMGFIGGYLTTTTTVKEKVK